MSIREGAETLRDLIRWEPIPASDSFELWLGVASRDWSVWNRIFARGRTRIILAHIRRQHREIEEMSVFGTPIGHSETIGDIEDPEAEGDRLLACGRRIGLVRVTLKAIEEGFDIRKIFPNQLLQQRRIYDHEIPHGQEERDLVEFRIVDERFPEVPEGGRIPCYALDAEGNIIR